LILVASDPTFCVSIPRLKRPSKIFDLLHLPQKGRYGIVTTVAIATGLDETFVDPGDDFSPQSMQPVVHLNENGERQIEMMRWAFKLPDRPRPLFNARSEGIEHAKFWKDAFLKGRCIVPADAVYEWQEVEKGRKKPKYEFVVPDQEPFGMAAVWKLWKNPKTQLWERTFAVLTGEPNELMAPIHDRMTTFLKPRDYEEYLAPTETAHTPSAYIPIGQDESHAYRRDADYQSTGESFR
jgi:putative SOS response-associated peptidase YedK